MTAWLCPRCSPGSSGIQFVPQPVANRDSNRPSNRHRRVREYCTAGACRDAREQHDAAHGDEYGRDGGHRLSMLDNEVVERVLYSEWRWGWCTGNCWCTRREETVRAPRAFSVRRFGLGFFSAFCGYHRRHGVFKTEQDGRSVPCWNLGVGVVDRRGATVSRNCEAILMCAYLLVPWIWALGCSWRGAGLWLITYFRTGGQVEK